MIKTVIFDMGNVLMHFRPLDFIKKLQVDDKTEELLLKEVFQAKEWKGLDDGSLTEDGFSELLKTRLLEDDHKHAHHLLYHWHDEINEVEGMSDLLKELKDKGLNLYLLSNAGHSHDLYWKRLEASEYFDGLVVSAKEKVIKPDEKIYKILLKRFNLDPKECLFIDDLEENVEAARSLGIKGIVFKGDVEELRIKIGEQL